MIDYSTPQQQAESIAVHLRGLGVTSTVWPWLSGAGANVRVNNDVVFEVGAALVTSPRFGGLRRSRAMICETAKIERRCARIAAVIQGETR